MRFNTILDTDEKQKEGSNSGEYPHKNYFTGFKSTPLYDCTTYY